MRTLLFMQVNELEERKAPTDRIQGKFKLRCRNSQAYGAAKISLPIFFSYFAVGRHIREVMGAQLLRCIF